MSGLTQRIYRERRRLALVTVLAFFSGVLFYARFPVDIAGIPLPLVTGSLYAVLVGASALVICLVLPAFRFTMEAFALSRLIFGLVVAMTPELAKFALDAPLLNATIVVLGGILLIQIVHGPLFPQAFARPATIALSHVPGRALAVELDLLNYSPRRAGTARTLYEFGTELAQCARHADGDRLRLDALPLRTRLAAWIDDAPGRILDAAQPGTARA